MTIEALNFREGRPAVSGGMFADLANEAILRMHPELVARISAATDDLYPHRDLHVKQVALTVLRARSMA